MSRANDLSLVDRVYEAGVIGETWPDVLKTISDNYNGAGGLLFAFGANGMQRSIASPDIEATFQEFLRDGWAEINERPKRLAAANDFGFANDLDHFTFDEIDNDPVYRDFYAKRGLGWAAGTMVPVPTGDTLVFSFERAFRRGPFEDTELIALDALRPHLARAALLSARLDLRRAQAMTAALEAVGLPAAVLQSPGRLYAANPLFERLIPATVQDRGSRVTLADDAADTILADTLARLVVEGAKGQSRSIAIRAAEGNLPMIAHVAPVRGLANDIFAKSMALLMITPVDHSAVPTAEVLQGLFDLTPTEARVARAIAQGKSVEAISISHATSRETVRKQLAAVLGKTGLNRQSDLVSLLSGKGFPEHG